MILPVLIYSLFLSAPVCTIQLDLETSGVITLDEGIKTKQLIQAPISDGGSGIRVLVFGLNQDLISGKLLHVSAPVTSVRNIVGADSIGNQVNVEIMILSNPQNLRIKH